MYSLTSRDPNGVSMTSSRDPRANTPLPHYLIPRHRNCLGHKNIIVNEWLDDPPTSPTPDHILDSGMAQTTPRYRLAPALRPETPCTRHANAANHSNSLHVSPMTTNAAPRRTSSHQTFSAPGTAIKVLGATNVPKKQTPQPHPKYPERNADIIPTSSFSTRAHFEVYS